MPVGFGADELHFDANSRGLDASGHVRVDEPPFHLTSDALRLTRVPIGAVLEGEGKLSFCPCLGTPLAVRFSGATIAPPHDLILRNPVLEVFGIPLAWAPVFWLRSPGRIGLLAPDLSWRGADGFFAGTGVHLPWRQGDTAHGMDLRAGGYVDGGVAVEALIQTTATETRVKWDDFKGQDGISVAAHGATAIANGDRVDSAAWSAEALRGVRAVTATTDLDAAARAFDRAEVQAAWRPDGWILASGVRWVALRGANGLDDGVAGPVAEARRSDAIGHVGAYDATFEGGQVASTGGPLGVGAPGAGPTSFARAEGGTMLATRFDAIGASMFLRGIGVAADDGTRAGVDGAAQLRLGLALPFVKAYASSDESDPWIHRTEPRLDVALLETRTSGVLVVPAGRGALAPDGGAFVAAAGWSNAVGRVGSRAAAEIDLTGGVVGDDQQTVPALRARVAVTGPWLAVVADFARVLDPAGDAGGALVARARLGPADSLNLSAHVAERDGVDPILARALVDLPLEPASGFLSTTGWTGGARLAIPLGSRVTTRGGADLDLTSGELVAAIGSLELHDPCNCVVVRATAAHRIGRDGIDAWLSVDLPLSGR